jgi:hypothetical protein
MPTLILPPRSTADCDALAGAAARAGWHLNHAPGWRFEANADLPPDPVLYADPLFADVAAGPLGIALLDPPLAWLARLPRERSGRDVRFLPLGEARHLPGPLFAKPADDKCFPARVYADGGELPGDDLLPPDLPTLIQEPVVWEVEYRCFVQDRKVRALSPYMRFGELAQVEDGTWPAPPGEAADAEAFAQSVLDDDARVGLPPAVVLDVGIIAGRGWAVVEANAAWGSGIYGCDPDAVLPVVRRANVPRAAITPADVPWVRPTVMVEG